MKEGKYRLEFCVGKYVLMPVDASRKLFFFCVGLTVNFQLLVTSYAEKMCV